VEEREGERGNRKEKCGREREGGGERKETG